jgi:hypothetical protein
MQFVDKALARRLESCEEMPQVLYARLFQKTCPEIGAAEEEVCGGHMIFAELGSPIGRATGAGLDRAFTPGDLDRLEEFYRAHKAPAQVDLCPMHEPTVFELFKERGYAIAELNNVLFRSLGSQEKLPPPPADAKFVPASSQKLKPRAQSWKARSSRMARQKPIVASSRRSTRWSEHWRSWPASTARWWPAARGSSYRSTGSLPFAEPARSPNSADAACRPRCFVPAWPRRSRRDASTPWW